jgi:hypothetical protein
MASLIVLPPSGGSPGPYVVATPGGVTYTFDAGIAKDVLNEHVAYVTAALQAIAGTVAPPAAPTVAPAGTPGTTTYGYEIVAVTADGDTPPSPEQRITNGFAVLTAPNGNVISWTAPAALAEAITGYKVLRSTGGATQGLLGTVDEDILTFTDTGGVATTYTPAVSNPGQIAVVAGPGEL